MKLIGQPAVKLWGFLQTAQLAAVTLTFDFEIGPRVARVLGTLPTKFGLPRPFRFCSRWRHTTEKRTDGQTDGTAVVMATRSPGANSDQQKFKCVIAQVMGAPFQFDG